MAGTLDLPLNPARRHLFRTTESMRNAQTETPAFALAREPRALS